MAGNPKFGKRIRKLREEKRKDDPTFSLRKFAEQVGISATYMSKVENGEFDPPRAEKIIRMAELLGVDPDELLALAGKMDPQLSEIIRGKPKAMADFLRTAREKGLTAEDIERITRNIKKKRP